MGKFQCKSLCWPKGLSHTYQNILFDDPNHLIETNVQWTFLKIRKWADFTALQLQTQLTWFCRQWSKSSSAKLGILFSLLFSVFPLLSLRSCQLSSHCASHFSQILFSCFSLSCLFLPSLVCLTLSWNEFHSDTDWIHQIIQCVYMCMRTCV